MYIGGRIPDSFRVYLCICFGAWLFCGGRGRFLSCLERWYSEILQRHGVCGFVDQLSVVFLSLLQREVFGEQFIWPCFALSAASSGRAARESSSSASGAWDALEGRAGCRVGPNAGQAELEGGLVPS